MRRVAKQLFPSPKPSPNATTADTTTRVVRVSPSKEISREILAFRTITRLLGLIQQEQAARTPQNAGGPNSEQRLELKLTNALSTVAVIDHEVIAVVNNRKSGVESGNVCLIAYVEPPNDTPPPESSSLLSGIWRILFSQNFRRDSEDSNTPPANGQPMIFSAHYLSGLQSFDDRELMEYVRECWTGQTVASHLYIIGRLLDMKDSNGQRGGSPNDLLSHVIATCYQKIGRRLKQPVSKFFHDSLQSVTTWTFDEGKRDNAKGDKKAQLQQKAEIEEDRRFVTDFLLPTYRNRTDQYPALMRQARLVKDAKETKLYTKESHQEFHGMLLVLIADFTESLLALGRLRNKKNLLGPAIKGDGVFKTAVAAAIVHGYALQRLANGATLKMHLQTIAPLLQSWNRDHSPAPFVTEQERQERDEDIQALHESVQNEAALVKSYLDWFRLLISHFDAVDILISYVAKHRFEGVSIDILLAPTVDKRSLPWKDLFSDPKLLPAPAGASTQNKDILAFLTESLENLGPIKDAEWAWTANKDKAGTISCLEKVQASNVTSWVKCADKILVKLNAKELSDQMSAEITAEINSLHTSTLFFDALVPPKRPLTFESSFPGTLHCEACLASLMADSSLANEALLAQMKDFGPVMGVSKRCCPTCLHLLSLLLKDKKPFVIRGFHNTVSACTLPTWLPKEIVDSMNHAFGGKLREELVKLIHRPELLHSRTHSTGSERLSLDSNQHHDNQVAVAPFLQALGHYKD